jgi:hypothetical protein
MLAVQRQTPIQIHNSPLIHTRILVQPTSTPGLLSLARPCQRRQPREHRSLTKAKQLCNKQTKIPSAVLVKPPTSTPSPRGRNNDNSGKPKLITPRTKSPSSVRARRSDRQPSPPALLLPTDEESPIQDRTFTPSATFFDSFIDHFEADQKTTIKPSSPSPRKAGPPTLTDQPSGKLARRRQPSGAVTTTATTSPIVPPATPPPSSKSVPVPVPRSGTRPRSSLPLSRSQPESERIFAPTRICDDSEDVVSVTSPVTPVRPRSNPPSFSTHGRGHSHSYIDGFEFDVPKTAPILSTFSGKGLDFPFQSPTPAPRGTKSRKRQRTPSVDLLFAKQTEAFPVKSTPPLSFSSDDEDLTEEERRLKACFFASSSFQNSPSPDDLPPPDF